MEMDSLDRFIRLEEDQVIQTRWKAFCKKQKIDLELRKAIEVIDVFLHDVVNTILIEKSFDKNWISSKREWVEE